MDEKYLIEMAKSVVTEVDRVLRLDNSSYVKEFGCETDRTDKAKIEKVINMVTTLNFFIDKYYDQFKTDCVCNNSCEDEEDDKPDGVRVTPLYE